MTYANLEPIMTIYQRLKDKLLNYVCNKKAAMACYDNIPTVERQTVKLCMKQESCYGMLRSNFNMTSTLCT